MKKKSNMAFGMLALALVFGLALSGCDDPTKDDGAANQQATDGFKASYRAELALTVDTVTIRDKPAVTAALAAYSGLDGAVKALLPADTGTKLQELFDRIVALEEADTRVELTA